MNNAYQICIDACLECAAVCDHCASACLKEENVNEMARCIKLGMECAAMCRTTAQFMSLESEHANAISQFVADILNAFSEECGKHSSDHCRIFSEICYHCSE